MGQLCWRRESAWGTRELHKSSIKTLPGCVSLLSAVPDSLWHLWHLWWSQEKSPCPLLTGCSFQGTLLTRKKNQPRNKPDTTLIEAQWFMFVFFSSRPIQYLSESFMMLVIAFTPDLFPVLSSESSQMQMYLFLKILLRLGNIFPFL